MGGVKFLLVLLSLAALAHAQNQLFETRLIGSKDTEDRSHPYHVAVWKSCPVWGESSVGSGALLTYKWVLTSGKVAQQINCVLCFLCRAQVRAGLRRLNDKPVQSEGVERIITHEFYHGVDGDNDLALLKISGTGFIKNEYVNFVRISAFEAEQGSQVVVTGWHVAGKEKKPLQELTMDVKNRDECGKALSNPSKIDATNICVENTLSRAVCWNDYGAPAVAVYGEEKILVGIFSWTPKPGKNDLCGNQPGVFTNVANYTKWITNHVN